MDSVAAPPGEVPPPSPVLRPSGIVPPSPGLRPSGIVPPSPGLRPQYRGSIEPGTPSAQPLLPLRAAAPPALASGDVLSTLAHLGSAASPGCTHLARHLLSVLDYSETGSGGRLLLRLWAMSAAARAPPQRRDGAWRGGPPAAGSGSSTHRSSALRFEVGSLQQQHDQSPAVGSVAAALKRQPHQHTSSTSSLDAFEQTPAPPPPPPPGTLPPPMSIGESAISAAAPSPRTSRSSGVSAAATPGAATPALTVFTSPPSLALYATGFLRVILRRGDAGFSDWGIDLLVRQLRASAAADASCDATARMLGEAALSVLSEAVMRSRVLLLATIAAQPPVAHLPMRLWSPLVVTAVAEPTGLAWARSQGLVAPLLQLWLAAEHVRHAAEAEAGLAICLSSSASVTLHGGSGGGGAATDAGLVLGTMGGGAASVPGFGAMGSGAGGGALPQWLQRHAEVAAVAAAEALAASGGGAGRPRPPPAMPAPPMPVEGRGEAPAGGGQPTLPPIQTTPAGRAVSALLGRADRTASALLPPLRSLAPAAQSLDATVALLGVAPSWEARAAPPPPLPVHVGGPQGVLLGASSQAYRRWAAAHPDRVPPHAPATTRTVRASSPAGAVRRRQWSSVDWDASSRVSRATGGMGAEAGPAGGSGLAGPPRYAGPSPPLVLRGELLAPVSSTDSLSGLVSGADTPGSGGGGGGGGGLRSGSAAHASASTFSLYDDAPPAAELAASASSPLLDALLLPQPWPLPLVIPATRPARSSAAAASAAAVADGSVQEPRASAWDAADAAYGASLDALAALPWRVEVWAEWTRAPAPPPPAADPSGALPPPPPPRRPAAADVVRLSIACDTAVDLSSLRPELRGDGWPERAAARAAVAGAVPRPPVPCDGFITAVCVDGQGAPRPAAVPAHATLRAVLFCGAVAVSQLGEIPALPFAEEQAERRAAAAAAAAAAPGGGGSAGLGGGSSSAHDEFILPLLSPNPPTP